jgi:surface antigen
MRGGKLVANALAGRAGRLAQSGFRRRGTVVPGPAYDTRGMRCRAYTHTIYIDGRPQIARGAARRGPDRTWNPIG